MVAFMIAQWVEFSTHFVSPDQANQHMLSAQSPTTSNAYPSKLWLILPISILITIKGWFDIKKHEKDLKENEDKYGSYEDEGGEAEDNFCRM
jgi:hypothetical protein